MASSLVELIPQRLKELAIKRGELARRMGYADIAKGCRRMDQACRGNVNVAEKLREALVRGLEVDVKVVDEAIEGTRAEVIAAEDKAYRESFKPHAFLLTKERRPFSITIYAISGGALHRMFYFEEGSRPETYLAQARAGLPDMVPFFGSLVGYVINYTPDYAEKFDKEGRLIRKLDREYRVGESGLIIGGKYISESTWTAMFGAVEFRPGHEVD